jgi:hypothetical protein
VVETTEGAAGALGGVGDAFKGVGGAINIESLNTGVQSMVRDSCLEVCIDLVLHVCIQCVLFCYSEQG